MAATKMQAQARALGLWVEIAANPTPSYGPSQVVDESGSTGSEVKYQARPCLCLESVKCQVPSAKYIVLCASVISSIILSDPAADLNGC